MGICEVYKSYIGGDEGNDTWFILGIYIGILKIIPTNLPTKSIVIKF
jgi:hypothetical protein